MPDTALMNHQMSKHTSQWAQEDRITAKNEKGGMGFTNTSSPNNPFNTMSQEQYRHLEAANKASIQQESFAARSKLERGGLGMGNNTSNDNPLNIKHNSYQHRGFEEQNYRESKARIAEGYKMNNNQNQQQFA